MAVSRCICHNVPFTRVKHLAAEGCTFAEISAQTKCCTGCKMCEPYVRTVIKTGHTFLPILGPAQIRAIMAEAAGGAVIEPAKTDAAKSPRDSDAML